MGSRKEITLKEIAARVGVSVSTASRALQGHPSISAHVRRQVLSVADELGYKRVRGGDQSGANRTVGVIVPSIKVPYYARLVTGITRVAEINDHFVALRLSRYRSDTQQRHIGEFVKREVDGIIVGSSHDESDGGLRDIEDAPGIVFLDEGPNAGNECHISADVEDAGYQAAQYLISLGHRELLYLSGPESKESLDRRLVGVSRALREAGLAIKADRRVKVPAFQVEPTIAAMKARLGESVDFTAIVASDDVLAFGAYRAAHSLGIRVPEDMSIIGLNGNRMSGGIDLTTVMLPAGQIGRGAMQMVIDLTQHKIEPPQSVQIRGRLVVRGSCAPPAQG